MSSPQMSLNPPSNQCVPSSLDGSYGPSCPDQTSWQYRPLPSGEGNMCVAEKCPPGQEGKSKPKKSAHKEKKEEKKEKKSKESDGSKSSTVDQSSKGDNGGSPVQENKNNQTKEVPPPGAPPADPPPVRPGDSPPFRRRDQPPVIPGQVTPPSEESRSSFNIDIGKILDFTLRFIHVGGTVNWERLGATSFPNTFNTPGVVRLAGTFEAGVGYNFAPSKWLIGPSCSYVGAFIDRIGKETTDKDGNTTTEIDTSLNHGFICRLLVGRRFGNHSLHLGAGVGAIFREADLMSLDPNERNNRASLFDLNFGYGFHFKDLPNHFFRFGLHLYLIPDSLKPGEPRPDIYIGPGISFQ